MYDIHSVIDKDFHYRINPSTKKIQGNVKFLTQYDHNSEIITFEIPRYIEGHDMFLCDRIKVNYNNISIDGKSNVGFHDCEKVNENDENANSLIFIWSVEQGTTLYEGTVAFNIALYCHDDEGMITYKWGTEECVNLLKVKKSSNYDDEVIKQYPDVIHQIKQNVENIKGEIPTKLSELEQDMEFGVKNYDELLNKPIKEICVDPVSGGFKINLFSLESGLYKFYSTSPNGRSFQIMAQKSDSDSDLISIGTIMAFNKHYFIVDKTVSGRSTSVTAIDLHSFVKYCNRFENNVYTYDKTKDYVTIRENFGRENKIIATDDVGTIEPVDKILQSQLPAFDKVESGKFLKIDTNGNIVTTNSLSTYTSEQVIDAIKTPQVGQVQLAMNFEEYNFSAIKARHDYETEILSENEKGYIPEKIRIQYSYKYGEKIFNFSAQVTSVNSQTIDETNYKCDTSYVTCYVVLDKNLITDFVCEKNGIYIIPKLELESVEANICAVTNPTTKNQVLYNPISALNTEDKTIVGAINELKDNGFSGEYKDLENKPMYLSEFEDDLPKNDYVDLAGIPFGPCNRELMTFSFLGSDILFNSTFFGYDYMCELTSENSKMSSLVNFYKYIDKIYRDNSIQTGAPQFELFPFTIEIKVDSYRTCVTTWDACVMKFTDGNMNGYFIRDNNVAPLFIVAYDSDSSNYKLLLHKNFACGYYNGIDIDVNGISSDTGMLLGTRYTFKTTIFEERKMEEKYLPNNLTQPLIIGSDNYIEPNVTKNKNTTFLVGTGLKAQLPGIFIGQYNNDTEDTDAIVTLGNGYDDDRRYNVFVLTKTGDIRTTSVETEQLNIVSQFDHNKKVQLDDTKIQNLLNCNISDTADLLSAEIKAGSICVFDNRYDDIINLNYFTNGFSIFDASKGQVCKVYIYNDQNYSPAVVHFNSDMYVNNIEVLTKITDTDYSCAENSIVGIDIRKIGQNKFVATINNFTQLVQA